MLAGNLAAGSAFEPRHVLRDVAAHRTQLDVIIRTGSVLAEFASRC
jgi:hypothetical protein